MGDMLDAFNIGGMSLSQLRQTASCSESRCSQGSTGSSVTMNEVAYIQDGAGNWCQCPGENGSTSTINTSHQNRHQHAQNEGWSTSTVDPVVVLGIIALVAAVIWWRNRPNR